MAIVSAPFTGDRSKVKQVDPGKFQYEGNYYTGTYDNATNWGSNYADIGKSQPTTTTSQPSQPYGNDGFGRTSDPTTTNPYQNMPGGYPSQNPYPGGTPPTIDWTKFFPNVQGPDTPQRGGGAETDAAHMPAPPPGYTTDPNTGAWVWDGKSPQMQGPIGPIIDRAQPQGTPQTNPGQTGDWITQALQAAESTDDPEYWRRVISQDPKVAAGDQSAIDYWKNRIAIGDGARAVREGRTQPFQHGPSPTTQTAMGPRSVPGYTPLAAGQTGSAQDAVSYLNQLSHSMGGGDLSQAEIAQYAAMVGYKEGQPVSGAMLNQIAQAMMQARGYAAPGTGATTPPAGGSYPGTNVFNDPATKPWEDLINTRIQELLKPRQDPSLDAFMKMISDRVNGLNQPYTNPDAEPLQQWMRQYFQQLQGPTYTDAQRDTIQTQTLDPMERQRQARKQQVIQQMANQGMSPTDGPVKSALADIDRQFDTNRANVQAGLSVNEINQGRQNQAQAANVGGQLANFTQGQFANNENRANQATTLFGTIPQLNLAEFNLQDNRANQALSLARQIPDLAQSRVGGAVNLLNGSNVNPASLLSALQGFQQQGMNQNTQDQQFWNNLFAQISKALGF